MAETGQRGDVGLACLGPGEGLSEGGLGPAAGLRAEPRTIFSRSRGRTRLGRKQRQQQSSRMRREGFSRSVGTQLRILTFKEHVRAETQSRAQVEEPAGTLGAVSPWACQGVSAWPQEGAHLKC